MTKALQAAVGVDWQFAVEVERARQHFLPAHASFGKAEVFHQYEFGGREAVVYFGHGNLGPWVGDAGLGIRVCCARSNLVEGGVVVVGIDRTSRWTGGERQGLYVQRVIGVLVRVFGAAENCCRRTVADPGAVIDAKVSCDQRCVANLFHADFLLELSTRVAGTVVVVLPRDAGHNLFHLLAVHAVLVGVRRSQERERSGRRERGLGAVIRKRRTDEARHAIVFELFDANGHDHVEGARSNGVGGVSERL